MKRIYLGLLMLVFLFSASMVFADEHQWWMVGGKAKTGKYSHAVTYEWRATEGEIYLFYGQYTLTRKLSDNFSAGVAFRELFHMKSDYQEHRPMVNFIAKTGIFKNRSRLSWRGKMGKDDHWRFRNKTTISLIGPFYYAFELFVEPGKGMYRHRKVFGAKFSVLNLFLLRQETEGKGINVFGCYLNVGF